MHELSIMSSILTIVDEELQKHGKKKLLEVRLVFGSLTNIVPDALTFAFEVLTKATDKEGAQLILTEIPLTFTCANCAKKFSPEDKNLFPPCPYCQEILGHKLENGRELYIESIQVED